MLPGTGLPRLLDMGQVSTRGGAYVDTAAEEQQPARGTGSQLGRPRACCPAGAAAAAAGLTARNASILIPPNSATTATARSWSPLSWPRPSTAASTVGPARRSPASLLLVDCKHALVHCGCRLPVHPSTLAQQRSDGAPGDCLTSTQPHTF